ncbi:MAG: NAD-dependent epimerase/dehydratase family protein [bacterium]
MAEKVLVFGGSGFLGSHVADQLSLAGYEVYIFDQQESEFLRDDQQMIIGDITNRDAIRKAVKGMDYVYHFAAVADIAEAQDNPVMTIEINILSTAYILDACREYKVKRLLYGSTVYVYSDHGSFYRSSKQASELIIKNYYDKYQVEYTILRYGSLYGPRANRFNFIHSIVEQALREKKIVRKGDGEEIREYIHVLDAARASMEILEENFANEHVMITGTKTTRIKDLLHMISEMFHDNIDIQYTDELMSGHYKITPYIFKPVIAKKYILNYYHDLGQGLLEHIYDTYEDLHKRGLVKHIEELTK